MTEMSGWEVFDKIKSNPSWAHIPVVFLTARTDNIASEYGSVLAEGFIEKPFDIDKIIDCLHTIFDKEETVTLDG